MTGIALEPTFADGSLVALARAVDAREVSPQELLEVYLTRIERLNPTLHAFVAVDSEGARAQARDAARRRSVGADHRALDAMPFGIKDLIDVAGLPTGLGSPSAGRSWPGADAAIVTMLRRRGAVVIGKTTTYERGIGLPTRRDRPPPAVHPNNERRIPGGSSSGSAVAVAAALVPAAIGTDTGGSIRGPASYCGVTGLKPTRGALPLDGVFPLAPTLDHVGVLTRTVPDAAYLFMALTTGGGFRSTMRGVEAILGDRTSRPTVGVPREVDAAGDEFTEEVAAGFERALDVLQSQGARVTRVLLPSAQEREDCLKTIMGYESWRANASTFDGLRRTDWSGSARSRIEAARTITDRDYGAALRTLQRLSREFDDIMVEVDALASPTTPRTAPTWDEHERLQVARTPHTGFANLTGQPSISLPIAPDIAGRLPVGICITGRSGSDGELLRIGHLLSGGA